MKRKVYIGLGSNMGNKKQNLRHAVLEIERSLARVIKRSSLYLTEPVGFKNQDEFINAVALIETALELRELLEGLLAVEKIMGRVRVQKNEPRIIDLDILLSGKDVVKDDFLEVPHPGLADRRFVLEPLFEIASEEIHPIYGLTVREMLLRLKDDSKVMRLNERL